MQLRLPAFVGQPLEEQLASTDGHGLARHDTVRQYRPTGREALGEQLAAQPADSVERKPNLASGRQRNLDRGGSGGEGLNLALAPRALLIWQTAIRGAPTRLSQAVPHLSADGSLMRYTTQKGNGKKE